MTYFAILHFLALFHTFFLTHFLNSPLRLCSAAYLHVLSSWTSTCKDKLNVLYIFAKVRGPADFCKSFSFDPRPYERNTKWASKSDMQRKILKYCIGPAWETAAIGKTFNIYENHNQAPPFLPTLTKSICVRFRASFVLEELPPLDHWILFPLVNDKVYHRLRYIVLKESAISLHAQAYMCLFIYHRLLMCHHQPHHPLSPFAGWPINQSVNELISN